MSCKSTEKKVKPSSGFDLSSISGVLNLILTAFSLPEEPASTPPPPLILAGAKLRPGMSAKAITARIISRLSEAGLPTGDDFADGPNTTNAMISIITEEHVNSIQTEAVVAGAMAPGLPVSTVGVGNLGAPVASTGASTGIGSFNGTIT
jgi:hypothetical protein